MNQAGLDDVRSSAGSGAAGDRCELPAMASVPPFVPAVHTVFPPPPRAAGVAPRNAAAPADAPRFPASSPSFPPAATQSEATQSAATQSVATQAAAPQLATPHPAPPADPRGAARRRTSRLPAVGLSHAGGSLAYATLRDLSSQGAGIARRGRLELPVGAAVRIDIHLPESDRRISLPAQVRWCRFAGVNTYLGLRFDRPLSASDPVLRLLLDETTAA